MDIAAAMLTVSTEGARKIQIMYSAFLSFAELKEYLQLLVETGVLEHVGEERFYPNTDKGKRFLRMYEEVDKMVPRGNMLTKIIEK